MPKQKYSDEQLIELLVSPEYAGKNNTQIAHMLGMVYTGKLSTRLNQLRKNAGLPVSTRGGNKRSEKSKHIGNGRGPIDIDGLPDPDVKPPESLAKSEPTEAPEPESSKLIPFPFGPKDQVLYDGHLHTVREVNAARLVMYENATLRRKTVTLDEWNRNPDMVKSTEQKPQHRYEDVSRDYPPESVEDLFEKKPIERSPSDRKPATDNPDFATVFEIPAMGPTGSGGNVKPEPAEKTKFEQVAERMKAESKKPAFIPADPSEKCGTCEHHSLETTDDVAECNMCPEQKPVHIDLEMDTIHDDQMDPAYLFDRTPDMEREISETVLFRREYLDKIDQLLNAVMPCDGVTLDDVVRLAMGMLGRSIREEAGND